MGEARSYYLVGDPQQDSAHTILLKCYRAPSKNIAQILRRSWPTRLKQLPVETQNRLMNWGYAICDAALRKHFSDQITGRLNTPRLPVR